ncbi:hypothetical protein V8G54_022080 [Vigna mungo]|uniref:Uncharacterized protein n=1 Tax=Vigna mungo TaxID=3915 RepID=A0AAQ3RXZ0_VIGMU
MVDVVFDHPSLSDIITRTMMSSFFFCNVCVMKRNWSQRVVCLCSFCRIKRRSTSFSMETKEHCIFRNIGCLFLFCSFFYMSKLCKLEDILFRAFKNFSKTIFINYMLNMYLN